jgi:Type I restriction enzyme R protein N terminus (HSDR_N)
MSDYWQIAAGSEGRDYAADFLRFGMAFVGGEVQCRTMAKVKVGDCVLLKQGKTQMVAAGLVVERNGAHSGDSDKQWLRDFDGWDLRAWCNVDWHVPKSPRAVRGFNRNTIQKVWKPSLLAEANKLLKLPVNPHESEPKPTKKIDDAEILGFLINEGLRPAAAEELTQAFNRIRLLARYYRNECEWEDTREHETRTFLVMPLLLALGWSEQQLKIELTANRAGRMDVACFSKAYRRDNKGRPNHGDCQLIIETKGFKSGLSFTGDQAKRYAKEFPSCKAVVVTNGYCYKTYPKDKAGKFSETPSAYLNLLDPQDRCPLDPVKAGGALEVLKLLMTQSWR